MSHLSRCLIGIVLILLCLGVHGRELRRAPAGSERAFLEALQTKEAFTFGTAMGKSQPLVWLTFAPGAKYLASLTVQRGINVLLWACTGLVLAGVTAVSAQNSKVPPSGFWTPVRLGIGVSLLWCLQPLANAAVVTLEHRSGLLLAFFGSGVLYCVACSWSAKRPLAWKAAAFLLLLAGSLVHETAMALVLGLFIFDAFVHADGWGNSLRRQGLFLVLSSVVLIGLYVGRATTAGAEPLAYGFHGLPAESRGAEVAVRVLDAAASFVSPAKEVEIQRHLDMDWPKGLVVIALATAFFASVFKQNRWGLLLILVVCLLSAAGGFLPVLEWPVRNSFYLPALMVLIALLPLGMRLVSSYAAGVTFLFLIVLSVTALAYGWPYSPGKEGAALVRKANETTDPLSALAEATALRQIGKAGEAKEAASRAEKMLENVVRADVSNVAANRLLGELRLARGGDVSGTIACFLRVVEALPRSGRDQLNLGNALFSLPEKREAAIKAYETAYELSPGRWETSLGLGAALAQTPKRRAEGVALLRDAMKRFPTRPEFPVRLAGILALQSPDWTEPAALLHSALQIDESNPQAHYTLALLRSMQKGGYADAIAHYERAVELRPDYVEALYNQGLIRYNQGGDRAGALRQFERVLEVDPQNEMAQHMIDKIAKEVVSEAFTRLGG